MNSFWSLVGFEYKKILHKRSVQVVLFLAAIVTAISVGGTLLGNSYVDGEVYESNYEAMVKDRTYARALDGRTLDGELLEEAADAYARIPASDKYMDTPEYQTYARPYSQIYSLTRAVYNTVSRRFNMEDFQGLTEKQAEEFYAMRRDKLVQLMEAAGMSDRAKEEVLASDAQIEIPFTFSYTDGYTRSFTLMYTTGLIAAFVMAICIAPLFSGEYTSGADQLILTSKYGKNRLISAKLFTGFSLAAILCLVLTAIVYALSMLVFGFDGGNAPFQLYAPLSPYPLTMGQTALLLTVCAFFACILSAAITMLLSTKLKSPFGVIILISLLLVVPMFIDIPNTNIWLYNLSHLLPTNMLSLSVVADGIQYELLGLVIKPYAFLPIFAAAVSAVLTPFAYRSFKKHQIS